jgi:hypothetical protein
MPVTPPAPRHISEDLGNSILITIGSQRKWFLVLYLVFQVLVWLVMEVFFGAVIVGPLSKHGFHASDGLMLLGVWLLLFTAAGLVAVYAFFWQIVGRETIEVSSQSMTVKRVLFGLGIPKEYLADHLKDFRASSDSGYRAGWSSMFAMWGLVGGTIAFDYGAKTYRIGVGIDEAEAKQIIAEIRQKFPQYRNT